MEKNKFLTYFVWLLVILVIAVGAWILSSNNDQGKKADPYTVYNGYVIYKLESEKSLRYLVEAYANGGVKYSHYFKFYPSDLLNLSYENGLREKVLYKDVINNIKKDKIYFSYDPNMDGAEILSAGTLIQILGNSDAGIYKIPVVPSVSQETGNNDFPVKTCDDTTESIGVILMKYGDPIIYSEGECVILQGNNTEEFKRINDLLSYILLGVI